ncbi:MAG: 5'/3'-nucleotidase SurE [Bacteroidia bacterium]
MARPLILVCNDDGIHAPGIRALIEAVEVLGDIIVVAPDRPQSGMGHAVTIGEPLRINQKDELFGKHKAFETTGTPVDCVKLAVDKILHKKPDLLVSGINHGSNSSVNVIYSGTMSAAVEGAIEGIPSVGFSLCDYAHDADFSLAASIARDVAAQILKNGLMPGTLLNVNIPKIKKEEFKGVKVCRQAAAKWSENFEERTDPHRKKYYWMVGEFLLLENSTDTDEWALANNYASLVPVQFDLTAHHAIPYLNKWNFEYQI